MASMKRLERLDVVTSDLNDAVAVYGKNFGFNLKQPVQGDSATIAVGGAEIRLLSGAGVQDAIASNGEGMTGLWLEAEDVDQVASKLKEAGVECPPLRREQGMRVLAVDPKFANQVPLFIFDRRA